MDQVETTLDTLSTKTNKLFRKPVSRRLSIKKEKSKYRSNKHLRESTEILSLEGTQRGESMTHLAISQSSEKYGQLKSMPMGGLYGTLESVLENSPSMEQTGQIKDHGESFSQQVIAAKMQKRDSNTVTFPKKRVLIQDDQR